MSKRFIYCNIANQEEEYYSKIKEENEVNINKYNEKKKKEDGDFNMGVGGAGGNLLFFIIFLIIGIVFLKKKEKELPKKKKGKKTKNSQSSDSPKINKPVGISLIVLGIFCLLSMSFMVYFVMHTMKKKKERVMPVTSEDYDYKRPCYSRKQSKMIGENEDDDSDEENEDDGFLSGITLPRLPDAARRMSSSANTNNTNNDSRANASSGNNTFKFSDVSGLTVTGSTTNNESNKGGTFNAESTDVQTGWDATKDSSGDIVRSDGTRAGTSRETF